MFKRNGPMGNLNREGWPAQGDVQSRQLSECRSVSVLQRNRQSIGKLHLQKEEKLKGSRKPMLEARRCEKKIGTNYSKRIFFSDGVCGQLQHAEHKAESTAKMTLATQELKFSCTSGCVTFQWDTIQSLNNKSATCLWQYEESVNMTKGNYSHIFLVHLAATIPQTNMQKSTFWSYNSFSTISSFINCFYLVKEYELIFLSSLSL